MLCPKDLLRSLLAPLGICQGTIWGGTTLREALRRALGGSPKSSLRGVLRGLPREFHRTFLALLALRKRKLHLYCTTPPICTAMRLRFQGRALFRRAERGRKGGRGRKLSHFSFCCALCCCVVYSPCFPVWGEEKKLWLFMTRAPLPPAPFADSWTLCTNTGQDWNFQRTLSAIGPYGFRGKFIRTNHWCIPFPEWSWKFF